MTQCSRRSYRPFGKAGKGGYLIIKPLNFVHTGGYIYFHSAMEGEKRGDLLRDSRVCFKVHAPVRYAKAKGDPCSAFCRRYRSAIPLQYGAGLRNVKCLRLRIRDIDFSRNEIHIGDGKDRIAVLSQTWESHLQDHPKAVKVTHAKGILEEQGRVRIPMALDEKYPNRRIA